MKDQDHDGKQAGQTVPLSKTVTVGIVVSKRAMNRLADLQYKLDHEMQLLSAQNPRLMGALIACDVNTQRAMMLEYRDQLHAVHSVLSRLCVVIDRYGQDVESVPPG